MIEFKNFPPKTPEDIQFTPAAEEQIMEAISIPSEIEAAQYYFRGIGTSVGHTVIAAMEKSSSVAEICGMAQGLKERIEEMAEPYHNSFSDGFKSAVSIEKNYVEVRTNSGGVAV
jgi:hypothetical protein